MRGRLIGKDLLHLFLVKTYPKTSAKNCLNA
jgi:hypothetical protein